MSTTQRYLPSCSSALPSMAIAHRNQMYKRIERASFGSCQGQIRGQCRMVLTFCSHCSTRPLSGGKSKLACLSNRGLCFDIWSENGLLSWKKHKNNSFRGNVRKLGVAQAVSAPSKGPHGKTYGDGKVIKVWWFQISFLMGYLCSTNWIN